MTKRIEEAADLTTLWACARQTLNLKPLTEAKKLLFAMPQGFSAKSSLSLSLSLSLTHTHKPSTQKGVGFCRIDVHIKKLQTEGD